MRLWAVLSLGYGAGDSCRIRPRMVARALHTGRENVETALGQLVSAGYVFIERDGSALAVTLVPDQWGVSRATTEVASLC